MIKEYAFPDLDTSFWQLDNKEWVCERKKNWEVIEKYYSDGLEKSKKGMSIIKRYYLKGEMPDFESLKSWNDETTRHLDLYSFLWLHPSRDKNVLINLRDAYVNCELINEYDIKIGLTILFETGFLIPIRDAKNIDVEKSFCSGGVNLLLFTIILGDLSKESFPEYYSGNRKVEKFRRGYDNFFSFGKWLCIKELSYLSEDCLYQYDDYLTYWVKCCDREACYFDSGFEYSRDPLVKALHRINRFDADKEGDTARRRFVLKIRKLLDEHEFHPTLKELWEEVKNDNREVKGLWRL